MNRWVTWGAIAIVAAGVLFIGVYLYAANSEPYRFSEQWLRSSAELREKVGELKRTRLALSGDFSDEFRGDVREARVSTYVDGEKGSLIASLELRKTRDEWVVVRCRLEPN